MTVPHSSPGSTFDLVTLLRLALGALAAVVTLGAGCSRDDRERVTIRDSAGVAITENATDAVERAAAWTIDSQPTLTIGELEGDSAHQLYRAGGAARLGDGRIAILNAGTSEVRFFGADGRHLRSVGRKGSGPGEFQSPFPLLHLPHDTIGVWDGSQQRITVFSPDGELVRVAKVDRPATNAEIVGVFGDGSIVMADFRFDVPQSGFEVAPGVLTRYSPDGVFADSLGSYPWREIGMLDPVARRIGSRTFAPRTSTAIHGDRFWVGTAAEPTIEVRDKRGKLIRLVRWNPGDRTVGPDDARVQFEARNPNATPERRRAFEAIPVMDRYPTHSRMIADADGNLWVQSYRRPTATGPVRWLIFDPDGAVIARIDLPPRLDIFEIGRDYVLGVHPGDDDLERIVLHPLRRR